MNQRSQGEMKAMDTMRWWRTLLVVAFLMITPYVCWAEESKLSPPKLQQQAEQGNPEAQFTLGKLHAQGQEVKQARMWWLKAAAQGQADAQLALGWLYEHGVAGPQDYGQAAAWYLKAAQQGNAIGQMSLGLFYHQGLGVPQDDVEAYAWGNIAAAQGDAIAIELRDLVREELEGDSLARAQVQSKAYFEKYVVPFR